MSRPSRPSATVTKNQSPRTQAWMDPITYGKATRKLIYDTSIATITSPYNQHIRRSLGFRETSAPGKGKPVFASERVEHLYYELDRMAVHVLPNNSHEALMQAWQAQEYTDDVERLLRELGGKIWGDSIEERKLSSNPNSQLLTTGDPGASGDLLYEHKRHREFIALQLEHLMFVKAKAFYFNHYRPSASFPKMKPQTTAVRSSRVRVPSPRKSSSVRFTSENKCTVVFRVPSDKLRAILHRTSSRISKKRARDAVGQILPNDFLVATQTDNSSEDEQTRDEDRSSTATMNEDNEAVDDQPVSEEEEKVMRADLTILLYRELCLDDDDSHTKLPDARSMLEASEQLDNTIRQLWNRDEDKIRVILGDAFEQAYRTLYAWLSWREGCWSLCQANGVHPLESKPTPRFTPAQWEHKLGGGEKCRKFHQRLVNHRRTLLASNIHKDALNTAKCLSRVFAAIAESPILEYRLREHIVAYNELLFAQDLDLCM